MQPDLDPSDVNWRAVNRAIDSIDCRELARQYGADIVGEEGDELRIFCPVHADRPRPACLVYAEGVWCFSCEFGGGPLTLFNELAGMGCNLDDDRARDTVKLALAETQGVTYQQTNGGSSSPPQTKRNGHNNRRELTHTRRETSTLPMPCDARREILGRIWRITEPLGLTDAARAWLEGRGIRPMVAQAYGWRDWWPKFEEIRSILAEYDADDWKRAGLLNGDGDDAWYPLRKMRDGDETERGLAVPVWHPEIETPVAYRWRTYSPDAFRKVYQQTNGTPDWSSPPLGLREPSPEMHVMMAQHDHGWLYQNVDVEMARQWIGTADGSGSPDIVPHPLDTYPGPWMALVCEGETDMLAAADAALELDTHVRIVPVALTRKASTIPEDVLDLLAEADHVLVALDAPDNGESDDAPQAWVARKNEINRALIARYGEQTARQRLTYAPVREGDDLADWHTDGELTDYLRRFMEGDR